MTYPLTPGAAQGRDTSVAAAEVIAPKAATLRKLVYDMLKDRGPMDAEEMAQALNKPYCSIQPRLSELARAGLIFDSGNRHLSRYQRSIIVWQAMPVSVAA